MGVEHFALSSLAVGHKQVPLSRSLLQCTSTAANSIIMAYLCSILRITRHEISSISSSRQIRYRNVNIDCSRLKKRTAQNI